MFQGEVGGSILASWMLQGQKKVGKSTVTTYKVHRQSSFAQGNKCEKVRPGKDLIMEYLGLTEVMSDATDKGLYSLPLIPPGIPLES